MKKSTLFILLLVSVFITSGFFMAFNNVDTKEVSHIDSILNEYNVYNMILKSGIKYPEVVMSQIMIESGNLTSNLCLKNNNLIGMTVPSKRETTAINKKGYAKYTSWIECIADYKMYQDYILSNHNLNTKLKYISFLHKNYAKSKFYKYKLITMSKVYELRNPYYFGSI